MNNPKPTRKVFDIALPGKTAASATARPAMAHTKPQPDPMMVVAKESEAPSERAVASAPLLPAKPVATESVPKETKATLVDLDAEDNYSINVTTTKLTTEPVAEPIADESGAEPEVVAEPEAAEPDYEAELLRDEAPVAEPATPPAPAKPVVQGTVNDMVAASPVNKPVPTAEQKPAISGTVPKSDDEEPIKTAQQLIDSKRYYLPIREVKQKSRARKAINVFLGTVLVIVLILAVADVALDDGIVTTTYNLPHTHYFTN